MRIHCIGFAGDSKASIAGALYQNNVEPSGRTTNKIADKKNIKTGKYELSASLQEWEPEKIDIGLDAVIVGGETETNNPEVLKAKELDIPIFSPAEFLYEHAKYKTRVVISGVRGTAMIMDVILNILEYHNKDVDYILGQNSEKLRLKLTQKSDFIILEDDQSSDSGDDKVAFQVYRPNIALLTGIEAGKKEASKIFMDSIVKGGILVFNEEDLALKEMVEGNTNTIRKHPYRTPAYKVENEKVFLETPEGGMPMENIDRRNLKHLAGAKWICQHLGVDEDDFYEAIGSVAMKMNTATEN